MRNIFYSAPKWTIELDDEKIKIMSYTPPSGEKSFVIYVHKDLL